jgi:TatD DNase family protein
MFIDTHCHVQFEQFNDDRAMVIGNAKKAGVKKFIVPGVDILSSQLSVELASQHPGVIFAGIGFHPYEASHDPDLGYIEKLLTSSRSSIVAIGECGLDYHMFKGENALGKKQEQKILFEEQLQVAVKYNLPAIMHCRDAYEDFFDVLDSLPSMPKGVIHCFSGGLQELRFAQARHFTVGIDGNVTYSKQLDLIVPHIPVSMLILETDSPYLTPAPHRGQRNEPKHIPLIAEHIARLIGVTPEIVEAQTTQNARTLFTLPA